MTDEKKDSNVKDIKPEEKKSEVPQPMPIRDPTHWALPIPTIQKIIKYLKKQPMEDVEEMVAQVHNEMVPLALAPKQRQTKE